MSFGPVLRFTVGELRIEMAPLTKEALGEFINPGMNDPLVSKYLKRRHGNTLEDEVEWYDRVRKADNQITWGLWLLGEGGGRTLIGNSTLEDIQRKHIRQATSGSMIFRLEYWGKGIASAAHKVRTWYAFSQLGLHRVTSAVIHGNGGSLKALSRSGYNLVYVERNTVFVDGQLRHQDNLECLNPLEPFWGQWWGSEQPTKQALAARKLTEEALMWAEENVE